MGKYFYPLLFICGLLFSGCVYDGKIIFVEKGCMGCHSISGSGGFLGPDLTAVAGRMNKVEIQQYIKNPSKINPRARMPSYDHLSSGEIKALVFFLAGSE